MNVSFESDFQRKLLEVSFPEKVDLDPKGLLQWRQAWLGELQKWHSPYRALIDCHNLSLASDEAATALERLFTFLKGFHLRRAVGFGLCEGAGHERFPFTVHAKEEDALRELGVRERQRRAPDDFRGQIVFQNFFKERIVEMAFDSPVTIGSRQQVATIKDKLMNNLRLWHSGWSLLVDCAGLSFEPEGREAWDGLPRFFKGFFLTGIAGYQPPRGQEFPFVTYRSRHRAVLALAQPEEGFGDEAHCRSGAKTKSP